MNDARRIIALELALTDPTERGVCAWAEDTDGNWETGCGSIFVLIEGKPDDNDMKFCCYCGGNLVQVDYEDAEEQ